MEYWRTKQTELNEVILDLTLNAISSCDNSEIVYSSTLHLNSKTGLSTNITVWNTVNWLHELGYYWKDIKKGFYKDGHDGADVEEYRQNEFLPTLSTL